MGQKKSDNQDQCVLSIGKRLLYRKRLFYIVPAILILSLFLILGFQNCSGKNNRLLPEDDRDLITELSLTETEHPDLLKISASVKSQVQDDFAAGSAVDLALTPSDHKNLQTLQESDVYTNWIISNEAWNPYFSYYPYPCVSIPPICEVQEDSSEICTDSSDSCSEYPNSPIYEKVLTVDSDTQFQFSDVGVYDIYARVQEIIPPKMDVNPDGSVTQGNFVYTDQGPRYERSLVIGKCDQSDLQIINSKDPIQSVPSSTSTSTSTSITSLNALTNDHLSYGYSQASRYASIFILELDGEVLEFEPLYYGYSKPYANIETPIPSAPVGSIGVESKKSEIKEGSVDRLSLSNFGERNDVVYPEYPIYPKYPEERKVRWKLMAEVIDPSYGRWYHRFDQQKRSAAWYVPWIENDVRYLGGITSGAKFSGKFIIEAFVQLPGDECVHSAKRAFQLQQQDLIPLLKIRDNVILIENEEPLPLPLVSTTTTTTIQGL